MFKISCLYISLILNPPKESLLQEKSIQNILSEILHQERKKAFVHIQTLSVFYVRRKYPFLTTHSINILM
jgi:hypothetical protein